MARPQAQPYAPRFLDAADEAGMLVIDQTAIDRRQAYDDPRFQRHALAHAEALVRRDRNHPSVIAWCASNEACHWITPRPGHITKLRVKLRERIKSLDPIRPVIQSGYGLVDGAEDVIDVHYPITGLPYAAPNVYRWPTEGLPAKQRFYPALRWRQDKPLCIGEFGSCYSPDSWVAALAGPKAYGSDFRPAVAEGWRLAAFEYRAQDVALLSPWTVFQGRADHRPPNAYLAACRDAFAPIAFGVRERTTRFYAGRRVVRQVVVFNDTFQPRRLTLEWRASLREKRIAEERESRVVAPGEHWNLEAAFAAPEVDARKQLALGLALRAGERAVRPHTIALEVFPTPRLHSPPGARVGLCASQTLARRLAGMGLEFRQVPRPTPANLRTCRVLVMNASGLRASEEPALTNFVEQGGRLILLEQGGQERHWSLTPRPLTDEDATLAFPAAAGHPVLAGISEADSKFWADDHVVARSAFAKPVGGSHRVLVEAGEGLRLAALVEIFRGQGLVLACQMGVASKLPTEPVAARLFQNMLAYAAQARLTPRRGMAALPADSVLRRFLAETGLIRADVDLAALSSDGALILSSHEFVRLSRGSGAERLRRFVESGGRLWIDRAGKAALPALKQIVHGALWLEHAPATVRLGAPTDLTLGLSAADPWSGRAATVSERVVCAAAGARLLQAEDAFLVDAAGRRRKAAAHPQIARHAGRVVYVAPGERFLFSLQGLAPGEYVLSARVRTGSRWPGGREFVVPRMGYQVRVDGRNAAMAYAGHAELAYRHPKFCNVVGMVRSRAPVRLGRDAEIAFACTAKHGFVDWVRLEPAGRAAAAERVLEPNCLMRWRAGRGEVIVNQLLWERLAPAT